MNDVTKNTFNILHLTWESPTLLWTFKLLMRAGETNNSLNVCFIMTFIGFVSHNMLLRHENVQIEVQLQRNWRIVSLTSRTGV